MDIIQSHIRQKEKEIKWTIRHDFVMSEVNARYIFQEEKQDIPHPWEYYPALFADEQNRYEKQKEQKELEEYKEKRKCYVEEFNRRKRQGR